MEGYGYQKKLLVELNMVEIRAGIPALFYGGEIMIVVDRKALDNVIEAGIYSNLEKALYDESVEHAFAQVTGRELLEWESILGLSNKELLEMQHRTRHLVFDFLRLKRRI